MANVARKASLLGVVVFASRVGLFAVGWVGVARALKCVMFEPWGNRGLFVGVYSRLSLTFLSTSEENSLRVMLLTQRDAEHHAIPLTHSET